MTLNKVSRAQSAIELVILTAGVLFFITIFFISISINSQDKLKERRVLLVREEIYEIQDEINLAFGASDGYERNFTLPDKIGNIEYNATLIEGSIFLETLDGKNSLAVPVPEVHGQLIIGENTIRKINREIYLNE